MVTAFQPIRVVLENEAVSIIDLIDLLIVGIKDHSNDGRIVSLGGSLNVENRHHARVSFGAVDGRIHVAKPDYEVADPRGESGRTLARSPLVAAKRPGLLD